MKNNKEKIYFYDLLFFFAAAAAADGEICLINSSFITLLIISVKK